MHSLPLRETTYLGGLVGDAGEEGGLRQAQARHAKFLLYGRPNRVPHLQGLRCRGQHIYFLLTAHNHLMFTVRSHDAKQHAHRSAKPLNVHSVGPGREGGTEGV